MTRFFDGLIKALRGELATIDGDMRRYFRNEYGPSNGEAMYLIWKKTGQIR